MDANFWGMTTDQWIQIGISLIIIVAVLILGRWVISILLDRILKRITARTKSTLDNAILDAARLPLYFLAVILALEGGLQRLVFLPTTWDTWLEEGFFTAYFLIGFIFVWRVITYVFQWYSDERISMSSCCLFLCELP